MAKKHATRFIVKVAGPAVGPGRLAARDVTAIATRLEQALKRIGQVLHGQESGSKGRKRREIEQLCSLYLVSWEAGSVVAGFELAEPPPQLSLFGYVGENSLNAFVEGMAQLSGDVRETVQLPPGFDTGVLESCESLAAVFDRGIDELTFSSFAAASTRKVAFNPTSRERVRALLKGPVGLGRASKVGRLEVLNGHDGLGGRLWEADGTRWTCVFKPEHLDTLPEAWLKTVTLVGEAKLDDRGREGTLTVEAVLIHGDESLSALRDEAPFWRHTKLGEMLERQDVGPVTDLNELAACWPQDEVFDDALAELLQDRLARRKARKHASR
ncbi:MAG TPA: hypothetical protein VGA50_04220 [Kiloniellales bacterium]